MRAEQWRAKRRWRTQEQLGLARVQAEDSAVAQQSLPSRPRTLDTVLNFQGPPPL